MYAFYSKEQLQPLIQEALVDTANDVWINQVKNTITGLVRKDRLNYRAFGPAWILAKKYLQDAGLIQGTPVDPDLFAKFTMGDETTDLMAAIAYQMMTTDLGSRMDTTREIEDLESGDPIDFNCADDDMESGDF